MTFGRRLYGVFLIIAGILIGATVIFGAVLSRHAGTTVGSVSTNFHLFGPDDKVGIERFDDPEIDGVVCMLSRARTGGISGAVGIAEDPSRMAISCVRTNVLQAHEDFSHLNGREVASERANALFKSIQIYRFIERDSVCYLVISTHLINGNPDNALSCIPR